MLLVSSIFCRWVFSVFVVNFASLLSDSSKFTCWTPFGYCFQLRPCFESYYLPTFRNVFLVFLIFSFCSRSVLLSTLCGPSRVLDFFHRVEWCLRLEGDLERLWWKLFILVNLDLSEIHKNNSGFWTSRPFGDDSLWPR